MEARDMITAATRRRVLEDASFLENRLVLHAKFFRLDQITVVYQYGHETQIVMQL